MNYLQQVFSSEKNWFKITKIAIVCVIVFFIYNTFTNLKYGIDLTDETYYATTAYAIIEGQIPFLDFWDIGSGVGFLIVPILASFKYITGSYDGSILFLRQAYFFYLLGISVFIILTLRQKVNIFWSSIIVLPLLCMAPYYVYAFSYNHVNYTLSTLACFVLFNVSTTTYTNRKIKLMLVGVLYSIATFAYPSFVIFTFLNIVFVYFLFYFLEGHDSAVNSIKNYLFGGLLCAALLSTFIILYCGFENLAMYPQHLLTSPYLKTKNNPELTFIVEMSMFIFSKKGIVLFLGVISCFFLIQQQNKKAFVLLPVIIGSTNYLLLSGGLYWIDYIVVFSFFVLGTLLIYLNNRHLRIAISFSILGPLLAILFVRYFSSNNNSIFFQAYATYGIVVMMFFVLFLFVKQKLENYYFYDRLFMLFLVFAIFATCYKTQTFYYPTEKVSVSIYKNLYTSKEMKMGIEKLHETLMKYTDSSKKMLSTVNCTPYMMSGMKIAAPSLYTTLYLHWGVDASEYVQYYFDKTNNIPDTIVVLNLSGWVVHNPYDLNIGFNSYINENYYLVFSHESAYMPFYVFNRKTVSQKNNSDGIVQP